MRKRTAVIALNGEEDLRLSDANFTKIFEKCGTAQWVVPHFFLHSKTASIGVYKTLFWQNGGYPFSAGWLPERAVREMILRDVILEKAGAGIFPTPTLT